MTRNLIRLWDKDFNLLWSNETGTQEEFDALITARAPRNRTIDFPHRGDRLSQRIEYQDNGGATFRDYQSYLSKIMTWSNPFLDPKHQGKWQIPPDPFIPEAWMAEPEVVDNGVIPDGPSLVYGRDYHFADGCDRIAPRTDNVAAVTVDPSYPHARVVDVDPEDNIQLPAEPPADRSWIQFDGGARRFRLRDLWRQIRQWRS